MQAGPFFGWINTRLPDYPDTINLKALVHLRQGGLRPAIELEPTDHPLAVEQRKGLSHERAAAICAKNCTHLEETPTKVELCGVSM